MKLKELEHGRYFLQCINEELDDSIIFKVLLEVYKPSNTFSILESHLYVDGVGTINAEADLLHYIEEDENNYKILYREDC